MIKTHSEEPYHSCSGSLYNSHPLFLPYSTSSVVLGFDVPVNRDKTSWINELNPVKNSAAKKKVTYNCKQFPALGYHAAT